MFIVSILLALVGILMMTKPKVIWFIAESWKSSEADGPSDLYNFFTRIGGVACTLAGIAGVIALSL